MDRPFSTDTIRGPDVLTLRRILERLRNTYCRSIGVQFMHIDDLSVRQWLQDRMEGTENRLTLSAHEQLRILTRLTDAVDLRGVHPEAIHRRQELFARRGREPDPAVGPGDRKGRRAGHPRNRAGHGPSRPAERAGQHHGQEPAGDLPRVRRHRSQAAPGPRRREISPGLQQRLDDRSRAEGASVAVLQSQPPGIRQPGGAGPRAGQAGPRRRRRARADAWRC